jgi:hypothetical protein
MRPPYALCLLTLISAALSVRQADVQSPPVAPSEVRMNRPLLTMTGRTSEIDEPMYRLAASQAVFDDLWVRHLGERVPRAAQGWPMTPQIDFDRVSAILIFGGDRINCNGYRIMEISEEPDALTIRFERISYQTVAMEPEHRGDAVRPWAMLVIPRTERTVFLEENVQAIIGHPPEWRQRAVFPGRIGVGRPVDGTEQR